MTETTKESEMTEMTKPTHPPINEENLQRSIEGLAAVGPFMRKRAAELGVQLAKMAEQMKARGNDWGRS